MRLLAEAQDGGNACAQVVWDTLWKQWGRGLERVSTPLLRLEEKRVHQGKGPAMGKPDEVPGGRPGKAEHPLMIAAPEGNQRRAYDNAKDPLHSSHVVTLIEEDEAADFARDLADRLAVLPPPSVA
jgi:hypothetical protein